MCVTINPQGISQQRTCFRFGRRGHGRNCFSLDPVAIDPQQTVPEFATPSVMVAVQQISKAHPRDRSRLQSVPTLATAALGF